MSEIPQPSKINKLDAILQQAQKDKTLDMYQIGFIEFEVNKKKKSEYLKEVREL